MSHAVKSLHGPETMSGVVMAHNFSPKGEFDGVLLEESGRIFQVNVPPHAWADFERSSAIGQSIEVPVEPEPATEKHGDGEHPAYRLAAPKPEKKGHHPDKKKPGHKEHGQGKTTTIQGIVARLNYAKHGEANGVVLESGEFIHLKPQGMKLVALQPGQEVTAEGDVKPLDGQCQVIEAKVVNGVPLT